MKEVSVVDLILDTSFNVCLYLLISISLTWPMPLCDWMGWIGGQVPHVAQDLNRLRARLEEMGDGQ